MRSIIIINLYLIFNITLGCIYMTINERENFHFDNDWDIHMSSANYGGVGYGLNLDLLTILCSLLVS